MSRDDPDFGDLDDADPNDTGLDADGLQAIAPAALEPNLLDDVDALARLDDDADAAAPEVEIISPDVVEIEEVAQADRFGARAQGPATESARPEKPAKAKPSGAPCPSTMPEDERAAELAFYDLARLGHEGSDRALVFAEGKRLIALAKGCTIAAAGNEVGRFIKQLSDNHGAFAEILVTSLVEHRRLPKADLVTYIRGVVAQRTKGLTRGPGGRVGFTSTAVDDALAELKAERAARGQA